MRLQNAETLLLDMDTLICDWPSISFDFLALNRPTTFLEVEPPIENVLSQGAEYRFGKVAKTMSDLCE